MMLKKKILLAEDDPDDREIIVGILAERDDVDIIRTVTTGVELIAFLEYLHQDQQLPDLIILDHNMPRMTGKETLKLLKASNRYKSIPVVVFSTDGSNAFVRECMSLGASMVSSKPESLDMYEELMVKFIDLIPSSVKK